MLIREIELTYKSSESLSSEKICLDNSQKVYSFLKNKIADKTKEHFVVILMDSQMKIMGWEICTIGTVSETIAHPREVFRAAIIAGAGSIIVCHNHPSGEVEPSREDIASTKRLCEASKIIGIPLLDHIIVSNTSYSSMKETGYI